MSFDVVTAMNYSPIRLADMERLRQQPTALVVDVRDEWEFDEFNLGGLNIPLADLRARKAELLDFDPLIMLCTNGVRSRVAAKDLFRQPELQHKTIYQVEGGIIDEPLQKPALPAR